MHQARGEQGELVKNGFQKFFLFFVSIPLWSRLWGWLTHIRRPRFLVRWMIGRFSRHYAIAMEQYAGGLDDYGSLADFFVRPLNPRLRPLRPIAGHIVSPADGRLSQLERIEQDTATQVKGSTYSLSCLLGRDLDFSQGWYVATIYLAPANYHRFHFPSSGVLRRYRHMGGRLFPVNAFSVNRVQRIYARNERVVAEIEGNGGPLFFVAVGATFVGGIRMVFRPGRRRRGGWQELNQRVAQLEEMGRFDMGSTIILVLLAERVTGVCAQPGQVIRVGDPLFQIK